LRLYLSSYRLGDHEEKLVALVGRPGAKAAVCVNALDNMKSTVRADVLRRELDDMRRLGFVPEELDLRESFARDGLLDRMGTYELIWISGGNVFLLAKAMRQSGFDRVIRMLLKTDHIVYAGYSAAFCVLAGSLRGMELVDDVHAQADGYAPSEAWDGLGLIDFHPIVHFRSEDTESIKTEREYDFVIAHGIRHETFRDGEVYLVQNDEGAFLRK
jgi:dipeptidase E